jgi:glycosyltransferase involved in cell wall biosynthesis
MRTYERPVMLARALTSVQKQTFTDWSVVVVNNGGAPTPVDDVVAIARLASPGTNIHVLHLDDRVGMEEASNIALQSSTSEYFVIHDDDDTWKPAFLERTVTAMTSHRDAAAIVTGVTKIHELSRGKTLRPQVSEDFYLTQERLTFDAMLGNNTFPPIAALFRRSLLHNVGMFDATLPVLGDWEFNLRAVTAGPFVFVPERLANYHIRTPESDVATGNSITVGRDRHRETKVLLHERWMSESTPDGVNKGEAAKSAHEEFERHEAQVLIANQPVRRSFVARQCGRVVRVVRHPSAGFRGVVRRVRRATGR